MLFRSISKQVSVSFTPNTYLLDAWLISSKNLLMRRFSWTNFTFASVSDDSSMAWLKPFSPPASHQRCPQQRTRKGRRCKKYSFPGFQRVRMLRLLWYYCISRQLSMQQCEERQNLN